MPPGNPSAPLSPNTQILLVAGGPDVANFAEEVVAQRQHFRKIGYTDDQIACYWARPTPAAYLEDAEQYLRLLPEIGDCYPAQAGLLVQHLSQLADQRPPWIYIYITSHGRQSMLPERGPALSAEETALLDQHFIQMGSDPGYGHRPEAVVEGYRAGLSPASLMLTPKTLRDALASFHVSTTKYVMLQACHSGGFLSVGELDDAVRITDLRNLVAIAAARHDRPSFGCEPGSTMTYFGEIFYRLLSTDYAVSPDVIDWETMFASLVTQVEQLEHDQGVPPSYPVLAISG